MSLIDALFGAVELALDRGELAAMECAYKIDSSFFRVAVVGAGPIGPELNALKAFGLNRVGDEPGGDEFLERRALVTLGGGLGAVVSCAIIRLN